MEMVNHPEHYKDENGKECIDCMLEEFGAEAVFWFCTLNAYKYHFRAGKKKDNSKEQDLKKAEWYENKKEELISKYELY
jgi:hypothetical protein